MGAQVEIGSVGDAFQLFPSDGELEENIDGARRVVGALFGRDIVELQILSPQAHLVYPEIHVVLDPGIECGFGIFWADEVLYLHLLELTHAEDKIARGDLVAEALAYLRHSEGKLA